MKFHEKLQRRVRDLGINKAKAARDAGLPESTISSYLTRTDSLPRIDIAAKIAKALDVPLSWLADDALDWPPPAADDTSPASLTDSQLVHELARRYRAEAVRVWDTLRQAESIDWAKAGREMLAVPAESPVPKSLAVAWHLNKLIGTTPVMLALLDPTAWLDGAADDSPGRDIPEAELAPDRLTERARMFREQHAGYALFDDAMTIRLSRLGWPEEAKSLDEWHRELEGRLKALDGPRHVPTRPARSIGL